MAKTVFNTRGHLTNFFIANCISQLDEFCEKEALLQGKQRLLLSVEEVLLRYRDAFGEEQKAVVSVRELFLGDFKIIVEVKGAERNIIYERDTTDENEQARGEITYDLLSRLQLGFEHSYLHGCNYSTVTIAKQKKLTLMQQLVLAMVLSLVTIVGLHFLPQSVSNAVTQDIIQPLFKKMVAVLSELATPLIFFAILSGVESIGNVSALGRMGKLVCKRFFITYSIAAVIIFIFCTLAYPPGASSKGGDDVVEKVFNLVLDIIPNDFVSPFLNNNDLQVIVIAIFLGFVLLVLENEVQGLRSIINELTKVVNKMMSHACRTLPLLIYLGFISLSAQMDLTRLASMWKLAAVLAACFTCITGSVVLRAMLTLKRPFSEVVRPMIPSVLINFSTASQMAAYPASVACLKKDWGIDSRLVDFSFPLGVVMYMPNGASLVTATAWLVLPIAGIPLDYSMAVKLCILGVIIAIAAPPIPGSAFVVQPIIFVGAGISLEYLPLSMLFLTIFGHFLPMLNGFCLQLEVYMAAQKLGMVHPENCEKASE